MSEEDFQNFKEVLHLIPTIIQTSETCLTRELKAQIHNTQRIAEERNRFQEALSWIQGKWTVDVLYSLTLLGEPGYNDLFRALPGINSRSLTDRLKLLEEKKLIERIMHDTRPVRVTYKITEKGKQMIYLLVPAILFSAWPELVEKGLGKS